MATEININEVKQLVIDNLPTYWHFQPKDVSVHLYTFNKFPNLEKEYISILFQYNNLGKVFLDGDKFIAKSSPIYGVCVFNAFDNLNEAIKFAVKKSIR